MRRETSCSCDSLSYLQGGGGQSTFTDSFYMLRQDDPFPPRLSLDHKKEALRIYSFWVKAQSIGCCTCIGSPQADLSFEHSFALSSPIASETQSQRRPDGTVDSLHYSDSSFAASRWAEHSSFVWAQVYFMNFTSICPRGNRLVNNMRPPIWNSALEGRWIRKSSNPAPKTTIAITNSKNTANLNWDQLSSEHLILASTSQLRARESLLPDIFWAWPDIQGN